MSKWQWWARPEGEDDYCYCADSRDAVIAEARAAEGEDATIEIVEAVMSSAKRHEGAEFVPFVERRNFEVIKGGTDV